ncbi:MAG: MerR family transcriptional regulator [Actinomycetota bacterium]
MPDGADPMRRRIGDVAAATGLTVRTLRYYEQIGLLNPAERTDAGHRLYGPRDLERLYRIVFLRQLGLPLDSIRASLGDSTGELRSTLRDHLSVVETRIATENRLRSRLTRLVDAIDSTEVATGDLLDLMEDMTMLDTTLDRRIAILVYDDIDGAFDHLSRVFGFGPGEISRDGDGNAVHAEIEAGDGVIWMHPERPEYDLSTPKRLDGASATMAIMVGDVDSHHRHAVAEGATIRYAPVDQPYGYREYSAIDPAGHLWSFMKPLT